METWNVYLDELPEVFKTIQSKKISIKIYNHSGQWSDHFFQVLEIKQIRDKGYEVTVLILFDPETKDATAIDVKSINMIELASAIEISDNATKQIEVYKNKMKKPS